MKKLIQVLRDRRGESMVEILVSTVVFMLLPPAGDDDAAYDFRAATPDGTETGLNAFRVRVRKQTVTARTPSGKTVPFCRFAKGE